MPYPRQGNNPKIPGFNATDDSLGVV